MTARHANVTASRIEAVFDVEEYGSLNPPGVDDCAVRKT